MRKTDPGVGCSVLVALDHRTSVAVNADLEAGVEALARKRTGSDHRPGRAAHLQKQQTLRGPERNVRSGVGEGDTGGTGVDHGAATSLAVPPACYRPRGPSRALTASE